jgi:ubiquinone/menaquinone biosynthesis C-methylase UbiE
MKRRVVANSYCSCFNAVSTRAAWCRFLVGTVVAALLPLIGFGPFAAWSFGQVPAVPTTIRSSDPAGDAKQAEQLPPALTHYKGREIAQTMHYLGAPWLVRESREREEDCGTMLKQLNIKPGQTVCDMGCGNGFYTLKLAELVGDGGQVLAVDIQPEMLHLLEEQTKEAGRTNVKPILGSVIDPQLPPGKVDLILCVDVYHEFSHPEQMLAAMRTALRPDGRLVLVEFRAEDAKVPIKPLHKMSKEQILKELPSNGYKLVDQFDRLPWQHMMFFQRDNSSHSEPNDGRK